MNYYSFHIGDYIKQTVHLTPMEDICYRRLLDMYYETEQPIPTETDRVSRRLRLDTELVDSVLKEFFTLTESGWKNERCEAEISSYHVKADTARSNGKLGGRPKKTQSVSDRNPAESGSKANQEPITNNQYINPSPSEKPDAGFAEFWKAYPKKKNKGDALKAWAKLKAKRETLVLILGALSWQTKAHDWTKESGQFIPYPASYLNSQSWLDEPTGQPSAQPTMTREEAEAKRKADIAAAREAYRRDQEANTVPLEGAQ